MELDKWREGLDICLEKIKQLKTDAEILMDAGSYNSAYYLFYAAIEQISLAYFLLERFDSPELESLKEFYNKHFIKGPISIAKSFIPFLGIEFLSAIPGLIEDLKTPDTQYREGTKEHKLGIGIGFGNYWFKRNTAVYLTPFKKGTGFQKNTNINQSVLLSFQQALNNTLRELIIMRNASVRFNHNFFREAREAISNHPEILLLQQKVYRFIILIIEGATIDPNEFSDLDQEGVSFFIELLNKPAERLMQNFEQLYRDLIKFEMTLKKSLFSQTIIDFPQDRLDYLSQERKKYMELYPVDYKTVNQNYLLDFFRKILLNKKVPKERIKEIVEEVKKIDIYEVL